MLAPCRQAELPSLGTRSQAAFPKALSHLSSDTASTWL